MFCMTEWRVRVDNRSNFESLGKNPDFQESTDFESTVDFLEMRIVGVGGFGKAFRLFKRGRDGDLIPTGYVLKLFHEKPRTGFLEDQVKTHKHLCEIGIETWKTFKIVLGGRGILMDDGEGDGSFVVGTNNPERYEELSEIEDIAGFENFVRGAIKQGVVAGRGGMYIPGDAWFASFLRDELGRPVRFGKLFPGDLDNVGYTRGSSVDLNKVILYHSLRNLIHGIFPNEESYSGIYSKSLERMFQSFWKESPLFNGHF